MCLQELQSLFFSENIASFSFEFIGNCSYEIDFHG
jgi:hypothetical protein